MRSLRSRTPAGTSRSRRSVERTREVVPEDVPFYQGSYRRARAGRQHPRRTEDRRDHAFRRIDRRSGIGRTAARLLSRTTLLRTMPDQRGGRRGREAHSLLIDGGGLRRAGAGADRRGRSQGADQPLWRVQADDRTDAGGRFGALIPSTLARFATSMLPAPIPQGRTGQIGKGSTHLIKVAAEAAVGKRDHSPSMAPTIRRPTAPAFATISTSATLPPRTSRRSMADRAPG